jgi:hypothetical protein
MDGRADDILTAFRELAWFMIGEEDGFGIVGDDNTFRRRCMAHLHDVHSQ